MSAETSRRRIVALLVAAILFGRDRYAAGGDPDPQREAVDLILQSAERLCGSAPTGGSTEDRDLSVEAQAELNSVLKKVADVGVKTAAKYQDAQYQGPLQRDLAKVLKNNTECKMKVFEILSAKLVIGPASGGAAPSPPISKADVKGLVAKWCTAWLRGDVETFVTFASEPFYFSREMRATKPEVRAAYEALLREKGDMWRGMEVGDIDVRTVNERKEQGQDILGNPAVRKLDLSPDDYAAVVALRPRSSNEGARAHGPRHRGEAPDGGEGQVLVLVRNAPTVGLRVVGTLE